MEYDDLDAKKLPRPFLYNSIVRYKIEESDTTDNQWYIYIKNKFFGWNLLAVRSGIDRAINYMNIDRACREPK